MVRMDRVEAAFRRVPRSGFVPPDVRREAVWDVPVPIGFGQTNSQPTTVQLMLTWLEVEPGDKVLDVGSGSGWTTALLGYIVGPKGSVVAVEKIPELVAFGKHNAARAGITNATFVGAGKTLGWPAQAPYDRILVSASARALPESLVGQLKNGGKMIIPVGGTILEISKLADGTLDSNSHTGFLFVPLL